MRSGPICKRGYRRTLLVLGLGLILAGTAGCNDELLGVLVLGVEDLTLDLISTVFGTLFESVLPDTTETTDTTTTVQAITEAVGWMC